MRLVEKDNQFLLSFSKDEGKQLIAMIKFTRAFFQSDPIMKRDSSLMVEYSPRDSFGISLATMLFCGKDEIDPTSRASKKDLTIQTAQTMRALAAWSKIETSILLSTIEPEFVELIMAAFGIKDKNELLDRDSEEMEKFLRDKLREIGL